MQQSQPQSSVRAEYIRAITTLLAASFAMVAGLAWNSAVQELFKEVLPDTTAALIYSFIYAGVVTVVAVTIIILLARAASKIAGEEIKPKIPQ